MVKNLLKDRIQRTGDDKFLVMYDKDIVELRTYDIVNLACCWCAHMTELTGGLRLEEVHVSGAITYLNICDKLDRIEYLGQMFQIKQPNSYPIIEGRIINELKKI